MLSYNQFQTESTIIRLCHHTVLTSTTKIAFVKYFMQFHANTLILLYLSGIKRMYTYIYLYSDSANILASRPSYSSFWFNKGYV